MEWPGIKLQLGYAIICVKAGEDSRGWGVPKALGVHRIVCWLKSGVYTDRSKNQMACHACHNKWCLASDHIYLGDAKTNSDDLWRDPRNKTRDRGYVSEYKSRRLFSAKEVSRLRTIYWRHRGTDPSQSWRWRPDSISSLSRRFNISMTRLCNIVRDDKYLKNLLELSPQQRYRLMQQVRRIRLIQKGLMQERIPMSATTLAKEYGVGVNCMYRMVRGIDYADLAMPKNSIPAVPRKKRSSVGQSGNCTPARDM